MENSTNPGRGPKFAYVVVIPNPTKSSTGIKRVDLDQRGEYMFWIKIGDSQDPAERLSSYKYNPTKGIALVELENCTLKSPGKSLENALLAGIGSTKTEWHALFAKNEEQAIALRDLLHNFIKEYEYRGNAVPKKIGYDVFSTAVKLVLDARYTDSSDRQANGKERESEKNKVTAVYVLVTPGLYPTNAGISSSEHSDTEFWIQIKSAETKQSTAYGLANERFQSHIPSYSFNGFRIQANEDVEATVRNMQEYLEDVLNVMKGHHGCNWAFTGEDGWYHISGEYVDTGLLGLFVEWFDEGPVELLSTRSDPYTSPLAHRAWKLWDPEAQKRAAKKAKNALREKGTKKFESDHESD